MEPNTVFRRLADLPEFTNPYIGNVNENCYIFRRDWPFNQQKRESYINSSYQSEMFTSPNHCDIMGSVYFNTNMIPYSPILNSNHIRCLPENHSIEFPSIHNAYYNTCSSFVPLSDNEIYSNPAENTFNPNYKRHLTPLSSCRNDGIIKRPRVVQSNKLPDTRPIHFWRPFLNEETSDFPSTEGDKSNNDEKQRSDKKQYSNDNNSKNSNEIQTKNNCQNLNNNIHNISPRYLRQTKDTKNKTTESSNKKNEDRILTMTKTIDLLREARKECDTEEPMNLVIPNIRNSEEEVLKQNNYTEGFCNDCKKCNYHEFPLSNTRTSSLLSTTPLNEDNESLSSTTSENVTRKSPSSTEIPANINRWQQGMKEINMSASNGSDTIYRCIEKESSDNSFHSTSDKNIYEDMHYQPSNYAWSTKGKIPNEYPCPTTVNFGVNTGNENPFRAPFIYNEQHRSNLELLNAKENGIYITKNHSPKSTFNFNHSRNFSLEANSRDGKCNEHEKFKINEPPLSHNGYKTIDSYCSSSNFMKNKINYRENEMDVQSNNRNHQITNCNENVNRYNKGVGSSIQRSNDNSNIRVEQGVVSHRVQEHCQNERINKVPDKRCLQKEGPSRQIQRSFHTINTHRNTENHHRIYSVDNCYSVNETPSLNAMMDKGVCKPKPIQPNRHYPGVQSTNQNYARNGERQNIESEMHSKEMYLIFARSSSHANNVYSKENSSEPETIGITEVNKHIVNVKNKEYSLAQNEFIHKKTTSSDIESFPEPLQHITVEKGTNGMFSDSSPKPNSVATIENTLLETTNIRNTTLLMLPTKDCVSVINNETKAADNENDDTNNINREQTTKEVAMTVESSEIIKDVETEKTYQTMLSKTHTNNLSVTTLTENTSLNNTSQEISNQMKSVTEINVPDMQNTNQAVDSESSPLQCVYCDKIFCSTQLLKVHLKLHPANSPYLCPYCDLKFSSKPRYMRHALLHTKEKPYCCEECHKCFTTVTAFHRHLHAKRHSGNNLSTCKQCGLSFIDNIYMSLHFKTHTGEHPFQCEICGNIFACKNNLKNHTMTHTGEKPFQCVHCAKRFVTNFSLKVHIRTHTKDYPYSCKICKKKFLCSSNMTSHVRTHTGEKRHQCYKCGKFFSSLSGIQGHQRTHTGECPYSCNICKRSFASKFSLRIHKRTHSGENPHRCSYCSKSFSNSSNMRRHLRIHTGERPYSCAYCTKAFCSSTYLKSHIRTHTGEKPYKCKYCGKEFSNTLCFKQHVNNHERKTSNPLPPETH